MLKIFVDSGSSIKQEEKEQYNVEIIPLRYMLGDKEYRDGIDLSIDDFYDILMNTKLFPKTSLPNLTDAEEMVKKSIDNGDDIIILPISSKLSGTYNALKTLFQDYPQVRVIDTQTAAGGIRLIVEEINNNRDKSIDEIIEKINALAPKIKVLAIPENLDYLLRGGRLSRKEWLFGSVLNLKPVISIINGHVKVLTKKIGLKNSMKFIASALETMKCDLSRSIIASYTKSKQNVMKLIEITDKKFHKFINVFDNIDPVISCHWGPNAFGFIFASK